MGDAPETNGLPAVLSEFPNRPQFTGFMKPCRFEGEARHLEVEGVIPNELDGTFYRVMPGMRPARRLHSAGIYADNMQILNFLPWPGMTMIRFDSIPSSMGSGCIHLRRNSGLTAMGILARSASRPANVISSSDMCGRRSS